MSEQRGEAGPSLAGGSGGSRLKQLAQEGQSVWLDFIDRGFLEAGKLKLLIDEDGLTGVTSNPSIFEKAIGHTDAYDEQLATDLKREDKGVVESYEALAITDIKTTADLLMPIYQESGTDGFVSIEVSPEHAADTQATIAEARRLWQRIDRPNLMVKVPGTEAGLPAIRQLIEEGINVNVTLLFAVERYKEVLEAFISGLEDRANRGHSVDQVAGVASFFVSRIDAMIDDEIDTRVAKGDPAADALQGLKGKVAIANAKIAYQHYLKVVHSGRWRILADKGALPQRLLWASTGTKNTAYSDVLYVESLIGRDTVNTIPPKTIDAFRDHGTVRPTLTENVEGAKHTLAEAKRLGVNLDKVTSRLVDAGVRQFSDAGRALLQAVEGKRSELLGTQIGS